MKDKCQKYRELIPLYADGKLGKRTVRRLERHVNKCESCAALLSAQQGGKLYIMGAASETTLKKAKKRTAIITGSAAAFCLFLVAAAIILRQAGFVRIASVTVDELSCEYIQAEYPELIISDADVGLAEDIAYAYKHTHINPEYAGEVLKEMPDNDKDLYTAFNSDGSHMHIYYMTAFKTIRISWEIDEEPSVENMSKSMYSRFKIFDIIKETRYINRGNGQFEKYTATLDLWGTLTRQELG